MSGGHWDYEGFRMRNHLENISADREVKKRFPKLAKVLRGLAIVLGGIDHDLDWDLSFDQTIKDDKKFEERMIQKLQKVVIK